MTAKYLMALDQGTTSSRAVLFDLTGGFIASAGYEFPQIYPQPGWVEHDPEDILRTQTDAIRAVVKKAGIDPKEIAAIGITNQRETTLVWERATGRCLYNAIVWQCRRTAEAVRKLCRDIGVVRAIRAKTGLIPDAYFSATKIRWLIDKLDIQQRVNNGEICFGTIDSFLCRQLLKEEPHVTDATNAGRTMLFNIEKQDWDEDLLRLFNIPRCSLPAVIDNAAMIGHLKDDILGVPVPVCAMAGDQHAALFGQGCLEKGLVKNTYGTGCFMLMNAGETFDQPSEKLLTTLAWRLGGRPTYALEGSVFIGGAVVQWLRDEMHFIDTAAASEELALSVKDTGGVTLIPAFNGLGAPYWDMEARGTLTGITRGTGRAHIVRAALESIAFQSYDLYQAMCAHVKLSEGNRLLADGGACANKFLMQFQCDILGVPMMVPKTLEITALGVAKLAGLGIGVYSTPEETVFKQTESRVFTPSMDETERQAHLNRWRKAMKAARYWSELQEA